MKYKKLSLFVSVILLTALLTYSATISFYDGTKISNEEPLKDSFGISGHLEIYKIYHIGILDFKHKVVDIDNVIVNNFLNYVRDKVHNITAPQYEFNYIAIGNGSGGGASSTALVTEYNRTIGAYSEPASYQGRLTATFTFGENANITESGVLNATTTGILMNYQDFSQISVTSSTELEVRWTFTYSDA